MFRKIKERAGQGEDRYSSQRNNIGKDLIAKFKWQEVKRRQKLDFVGWRVAEDLTQGLSKT
jgi:hypothetical protein